MAQEYKGFWNVKVLENGRRFPVVYSLWAFGEDDARQTLLERFQQNGKDKTHEIVSAEKIHR